MADVTDGDAIFFIEEKDSGDAQRRLVDAGWRVLLFQAGCSERSFFEAAKKAFPMDPPLVGARGPNWDALADSLFGGVVLTESSLAIIWTDGRELQGANRRAFEVAVGVFEQVVENILNEARCGRSQTRMRVLIVGRRA